MSFVVVDLLLVVQVPNAELIGKLKQVALVCGIEDISRSGSEQFKYVGEVAHSISPVGRRTAPATELANCARHHRPHVRCRAGWQGVRQQRRHGLRRSPQDLAVWLQFKARGVVRQNGIHFVSVTALPLGIVENRTVETAVAPRVEPTVGREGHVVVHELDGRHECRFVPGGRMRL
jgi:hypothetical protein